jgi:hypothetical protein
VAVGRGAMLTAALSVLDYGFLEEAAGKDAGGGAQ